MDKMAKVLISDKLSPQAVEIFKNNGVEVDVKTGLSADELAAIIGNYDGLAIRSATKVTKGGACYFHDAFSGTGYSNCKCLYSRWEVGKKPIYGG